MEKQKNSKKERLSFILFGTLYALVFIFFFAILRNLILISIVLLFVMILLLVHNVQRKFSNKEQEAIEKQEQQNIENLKNSEERFRKAFMTSPDYLSISKISDGTVYIVNKGFSSIFGYTEEELSDISKLELGIWVDPADKQKIVDKVKVNGFIKNYETSFRKKNGEIIFGLVSASIVDFENVPHILMIARDITDRKQVEEALRESEEKYRTLVDNSNEAILVIQDGFLKFVNHRAVEIINYSEQELLGKPFPAFIHPNDRDMVVENYQKRIAGEFVTPRYSFRIVTSEGITKWVEIAAALIEWKGKPATLNFLTDITERKQTEFALQKLNEELEARVRIRTTELENINKALEAFSYSVSHDLRAPLRAIDGFSNLLQTDLKAKLGEEGSHLLEVIRVNTKQMDQLITGLLELSKATKFEIKKRPIDMNQMVNSVYQEFVSEADREKTTLSIENLAESFGDPILIHQVWVNLLVNAVKFSRTKEKPCIYIQSYKENDQTIYVVKDNGVGFNPEYKNKLFNAFRRLHSADEFEGTGIGLVLIERIIQRHGGTVWAEGEEGSGATFYFSLPNATVQI